MQSESHREKAADDMMKMAYRIAVIEGDDSIRELVRQWLVDAGHFVEAYSSPMRVDSIDLIIADVASPREAGPLLALLRLGSDAPVLLLSARFRTGQEGSVQLANELDVNCVLPKPFTKRQLISAVRQSLSR